MDMESSQNSEHAVDAKRMGSIIAAAVIAAVIAVAGVVYAVHEHNIAQSMSTKNAQVTTQLTTTQSQVDALAARVNSLVASETKPNPTGDSKGTTVSTATNG